MIYIFVIALVNAALALKSTSSGITEGTIVFLFLRSLIISILFFVVACHSALSQ